jgi:hypothetical protein
MGVITTEVLLKLTNEILGDLPKEAKKAAVDTATNRVIVQNFPKSCEDWTQEQVDLYLTYLEKASTVTHVSEQATLEESISTIMKTEVNDITNKNSNETNLEQPGDDVQKAVNKLEKANSYRDDLKCDDCNSKVYDNRNNKLKDTSPDFVCSNNNPEECKGHTGQWRKGWWLSNSNIPKEWGI